MNGTLTLPQLRTVTVKTPDRVNVAVQEWGNRGGQIFYSSMVSRRVISRGPNKC